ncbi:MAG: amidohydrolase family protein, partial [Sphaerochaetaceae bacterium]
FYAHGIWFNDQELDILARNKATIAHCPASNMRLGSGICRVKEALERGINVSLAVDGSASNDSSDMLGELRLALLLQRVKHGSGALKAKDVLAMGTVNGARALGYSKVGMLKEGWAADLAAFDVSKLAYSGSQSDPLAAILFCGYDHQSRYTMVNGRLVVDEGRLVGIDEDLLARRANEQAERLYRKGGIL